MFKFIKNLFKSEPPPPPIPECKHRWKVLSVVRVSYFNKHHHTAVQYACLDCEKAVRLNYPLGPELTFNEVARDFPIPYYDLHVRDLFEYE